MTYPKVCLRRGEETGVRAGKPWIFENQLDWADDVCKDGGIVDVLDSRMRFAARGYFNSKSKITVRVPVSYTHLPAEPARALLRR